MSDDSNGYEAIAAEFIKVGRALTRGGRFLFTAPRQVCEWSDSMTGRLSVSLGAERNRQLLETAGLELVDETVLHERRGERRAPEEQNVLLHRSMTRLLRSGPVQRNSIVAYQSQATSRAGE